jgi:hypothetical protein
MDGSPTTRSGGRPIAAAEGHVNQWFVGTHCERHIEDLRAPLGKRLELLKGDRAGQWSVRVNDQFRICFRWTGADAEDVEIVDHH